MNLEGSDGSVINNLRLRACNQSEGRIFTGLDDLAILDQNRTIVEIAIGGLIVDAFRLVDKCQHAAAQKQFAHCTVPPLTVVSYQLASRRRSSSVMPLTLAGGMACDLPACR